MKKCVAIFSDWYNDEIEINGFMVMTERESEHFENLLSEITWDFTYNNGSIDLNYSSGEDLLSRIEFKDISNEEYESLSKVFEGGFGTFIDLTFLEQNIREFSGDDNEYDDEDNEYDDDY